jgi:di/tricarboxylate transporter
LDDIFLLILYLLFSCIAVSSFFWSFIFCSVVLPFLLSLILYLLFSCIAVSRTEEKGPKERRNGNTNKQKIKNQKKEETAIQLNRR